MCEYGSKRLWVVAVPADAGVKPISLVFFQSEEPSRAQLLERTGGAVEIPVGAICALDLTTAVSHDPMSIACLDAWARMVLAEGLSVRPLVDVSASAFTIVPSKRVHYGTKEQYFDEGGCLLGEIHYRGDGEPHRWLLDRRFAR
ncbi:MULTISPECIES: hypothetical protein [Burkholderia]|jgi:hypothetical protein|uniref:Uncharacterized protein n=2 Tax=Burkholderia cepacia complex TaxID=87882 RepID=A0A250LN63_9BURK|nr:MULTISPECIES: hypothetical protein [Burkholderia]MBA9833692.1 hypothetical protein [Burkholderia contaminans]MBA9909588.1 hypothetical protein [Burkholderia contaminans]MBR8290423.1 hypothetical protein [Burkholderia cenocepacia]MBX3826578.1 hypothetical protein [Burkholderia contaminans]MBX3845593.1 hypothetical protein [Burkholderia contaminans]